jgi:hypothetical protein
VRPRKIKRITLEAFLRLKELLKRFKQPQVNKIRQPRKKLPKIYKIATGDNYEYKRAFEPSKIANTRDSLFWSWRRVIAWDKYINDPLENKKGHKTMI